MFGQGDKPAQSSSGSLNDILTTPAMRTELATIVALCSDAMRQELLAVFTPVKQPSKEKKPTAPGNDLLIDFSDEPVVAIEGPNQDAARLERLDQTDIQSPRCQGLRRAALTYFDKWQIDVLKRIGETLSVRPEAVRKARADAKARAETAAKAKRDQAYFAWANGADEDHTVTGNIDAHQLLPEGFRAKILDLPTERRILVLDSVLLLLLSLEHYSSHSRMLMLSLTRIFQLPESTLIENESKVAEGLLSSVAAKTSADESTKRQASQDVVDRRWKVGLATVAGAALIGVTGGLAAPFLAAGIGGIMGGIGLGAVATLLGPLATNVVLVGGLFGAYGGRMTGSIAEKYTQEIKDFKFLPVSSHVSSSEESLASRDEAETGLAQLQDPEKRKSHKLRVAIGISGSVNDVRDFVEPWAVFSESRIEAFGLRWEMDALMQLGRKIAEVLQSVVWNFAGYQLLSMVVAGLWPFGLLSAARTMDSPFAIAKTRSDKAGRVLADALINRIQGLRPVTLVGYGLGARVIFSCLTELAEQNAFGLVESVVLMGAPAPSDAASWRRIRAVVSGRVINVFSANDFILGLLYRASTMQMGIAGVQKVLGVSGVENYDFTDMVQSHDRYKFLVGTILQRIGFGDLDIDVIRRQQDDLKRVELNSEKQSSAKKSVAKEKDNALAKEDADGRIVLVDNTVAPELRPKATDEPFHSTMDNMMISDSFAQTGEGLDEVEEEPEHQIRMEDNEEPMSILAPEPEPDYGPDRETVSFGSGVRGFNVEWDAKS